MRCDRVVKSAGRLAYEADLSLRPIYKDGTQRPAWNGIADVVRWSWERHPEPREYVRKLGVVLKKKGLW
jgi:hypothetical protein